MLFLINHLLQNLPKENDLAQPQPVALKMHDSDEQMQVDLVQDVRLHLQRQKIFTHVCVFLLLEVRIGRELFTNHGQSFCLYSTTSVSLYQQPDQRIFFEVPFLFLNYRKPRSIRTNEMFIKSDQKYFYVQLRH